MASIMKISRRPVASEPSRNKAWTTSGTSNSSAYITRFSRATTSVPLVKCLGAEEDERDDRVSDAGLPPGKGHEHRGPRGEDEQTETARSSAARQRAP